MQNVHFKNAYFKENVFNTEIIIRNIRILNSVLQYYSHKYKIRDIRHII